MLKHIATAGALLALSFVAFAAESSAARKDAYVAQMQFAQNLLAVPSPASAQSTVATSKRAVARLERLREQRFGLDDGDAAKIAAVAMLGQAVTQVSAAKRSAARMPKDFRIDETYPQHWRTQPAGDDLAGCRNALEHDLTQPLRVSLAQAGTVWLRISAPSAGTWAFDTFISEFDTRLSLYRDCRDIAQAPIDTSDDALGLGSIVGFSAKTAGETRIVKLERLGGLGDLVIAKGGASMTLGGRVTRQVGGSPVPNILVNAQYVPYSYYASNDYTDSDGAYHMFVYNDGEYRLRTGAYYSAHAAPELIDEAYPDIPCFDRSIQSFNSCQGTPLPVAISSSMEITGLDFALSRGAIAVGQVIDETTRAPVASAQVALIRQFNPGDSLIARTAVTDLNGRFLLDGLPPGQWRVEYAHPRYVRERWNDVLCGTALASLACPADAGALATLVGSETITLNADLRPLDVLPMRVSSAGTTLNAHVDVYTANGFFFTSANTDIDGLVYVGPLPPGEFRFVISAYGLVSRIYGGPSCATDCIGHLFEGQIVSIPTAAALPLEVELESFPRLSGVISDAVTGTPLRDARLDLYRDGSLADSQITDSDGRFVSDPLQPAIYVAHARAAEHIDELFPNVPCEAQSPLQYCGSAQPIVVEVGLNNATLDFALTPAGLIHGKVRTFNDGQSQGDPPQQIQLTRMSSSGAVIAGYWLNTTAGGLYGLQEIPDGTHLFALGSSGYRTQLYAGIDCAPVSIENNPSCPHTAATPLHWSGAQIVGNINFDLSASYTRLARVRDAQTLAPLAGVAVDQWSSDGVWKSSSVTNAQGVAQIRVSGVSVSIPATMQAIVTTDNSLGYLDQVFDGTECAVGASAYRGNCSIASATMVPIYDPGDVPSPRLEILLRSADPVFASGFE